MFFALPFFFFSFLILEQNYSSNSLFKLGNFKILTWLGKISYGIYLTHMIAIYVVNDLESIVGYSGFVIKMILAVILTIIGSFVSYKMIEKPFLIIKNKYFSRK